MSDFRDILNREIVDSGRVPQQVVIDRTVQLASILEDFVDIKELIPTVSSDSDMITFSSNHKDYGFSLYITADRRKNNLIEEEFTAWRRSIPVTLYLKGTLRKEDIKYAFNQIIDKEE